MVKTRKSLSHLVLERYWDVTDTKTVRRTDTRTEVPQLIRSIVSYVSSRA